jgi:hypothetical protein
VAGVLFMAFSLQAGRCFRGFSVLTMPSVSSCDEAHPIMPLTSGNGTQPSE